MGKLHVINTVKKELTPEEEKILIFGNLKLLRKISSMEYNECSEYHSGTINAEICGIDRSGREKMMNDSSYGNTMRAPHSSFGIHECNRRNYALVRKVIKSLLPESLRTFRDYMPMSDFHLWGYSGDVYWCVLEELEEYIEDPTSVKAEAAKWNDMTSTDICYEVLSIIRRKIMLDRLKGEDE